MIWSVPDKEGRTQLHVGEGPNFTQRRRTGERAIYVSTMCYLQSVVGHSSVGFSSCGGEVERHHVKSRLWLRNLAWTDKKTMDTAKMKKEIGNKAK